MLVLKIVGAVAAVGLGIWLGLPGRYEQSLEDVERNMVLGTGRSHKVKRVFTPLAWIQRKLSPRSSQPKRRKAFNLEHPDER